MLRPSMRATGCAACRSSLLGMVIGRPINSRGIALLSSPSQLPQAARRLPPLRKLSSFNQSDAPPSSEETSNQPGAVEENTTSAVQQDAASPPTETPDLPWYLQVEAPTHPTLVRQETPLPEVPKDSPRLIKPLLKFTAEDLGLDQLNLVDLRALDPPSALGPKLLMLFGTARSQRHLHVSADRLVRWLRSRGIPANADGLLGRNELKTKLRRKARRAKIMGTSAPISGEEDDGIATRWICVNLGTIGWTSEETVTVNEQGAITGFGTPQTGTTIVVQMMTEEKRQELGLEGLWTRILERRGGKESGPSDPSPEPALDPVSAALQSAHSPAASQGRKGTPKTSQARFFSTSARQAAEPGDIASMVTQPLVTPNDLAAISTSLTYHRAQKSQVLEQLRAYIDTLQPSEAIEALRPGADSALQRMQDRVMENMPSEDTWMVRAWLHCTALTLGHQDYGFAGLRELVKEMSLSGIPCTRDQYQVLLRGIFSARSSEEATLQERSELALDVLGTMHERGEALLTTDTFVTLIAAVATSGDPSPEAQRLQETLEKLMAHIRLPCLDDPSMIQLLEAYSFQGNWERFWDVWRIPARFRRPRSPRLYEYLYRRMASTGHQTQCIDALRGTFQEMVNEEPPVLPTGAVLEALKACIRVADPAAEKIAQGFVFKGPKGAKFINREFVKLWKSLELMQEQS